MQIDNGSNSARHPKRKYVKHDSNFHRLEKTLENSTDKHKLYSLTFVGKISFPREMNDYFNVNRVIENPWVTHDVQLKKETPLD